MPKKDREEVDIHIIEEDPFESPKSIKLDFFKGRPYYKSKIEIKACPKCEGPLSYPEVKAIKKHFSKVIQKDIDELINHPEKKLDLENLDKILEGRYKFYGNPVESSAFWTTEQSVMPEVRCENCGWEGKTVKKLKLIEDISEPKLIRKEIDVINNLGKCPDCGTYEGMYHIQEFNCEDEFCPICDFSYFLCECQNSEVNGKYIQKRDSNGNVIEKKERHPYINFPLICARCGVLYPKLYDYPEEEEEKDKIIVPLLKMSSGFKGSNLPYHLCRSCYIEVKDLHSQGLTEQIKVPDVCRYCGKILSDPKTLDKDFEEAYIDEFYREHVFCDVCVDKFKYLTQNARTIDETYEMRLMEDSKI